MKTVTAIQTKTTKYPGRKQATKTIVRTKIQIATAIITMLAVKTEAMDRNISKYQHFNFLIQLKKRQQKLRKFLTMLSK